MYVSQCPKALNPETPAFGNNNNISREVGLHLNLIILVYRLITVHNVLDILDDYTRN